jgi:hypothetical protein
MALLPDPDSLEQLLADGLVVMAAERIVEAELTRLKLQGEIDRITRREGE